MNFILYLGWTFFFAVALAQNPNVKNCHRSMSEDSRGYQDLYCRCNEVPQTNNGLLHTLTIDLSDCSFNNTARGISWRELDTIYKPIKLQLINVEVYLSESTESWNSTIERIDFRNCLIPNLTANAFRGVTTLKEIHFFNSYIHSMFENAIENLPFLETLEFGECYLGSINTNAINNLPNIRDVAFIASHIEIMRKDAIKNLKYPSLPVTNDCPEMDVRSRSSRDNFMMRDMTYRLLESDNIPLPKFGARLLFLRNNINTLSTNSINSDMFAFAIFGGNTINHMNSRSLNLALSNECEITALMFSTNYFKNIHGGALASTTSFSTATHETYLVLTNNTFEYVASNGFLIHPTLKVFTVEQNKFVCECQNFNWVVGMDVTSTQTELKKQIYNVGVCNGTNESITEFTSNCPSNMMTTSMMDAFKPWTGDYTTPKAVVSFTELIGTSGSTITLSATYILVLLISFSLLI